jgi:hypothetical protein
LPRRHVCRDGAKWRRQLIEPLDIRHGQQLASQEEVTVISLHEAHGEAERAVLEPGQRLDEKEVVVALAVKRSVVSFRRVLEQACPVGVTRKRLQLVLVHAGGIEAADHASHTRTGDEVDRNAKVAQRKQDADVRTSAGAAAGKCEADRGSLGSLRRS